MRASTREEAAKWVEVLKELQELEVDDGTKNGAESPNANMVRHAEGSQTGNGSSQWNKDSGCFGLFNMCGCWRLS